jgi:transposase
MRLFVGLDVSLEKTALCVLNDHGKIVKETQIASEPEVLARWIGEYPGSIVAVGRGRAAFSVAASGTLGRRP